MKIKDATSGFVGYTNKALLSLNLDNIKFFFHNLNFISIWNAYPLNLILSKFKDNKALLVYPTNPNYGKKILN